MLLRTWMIIWKEFIQIGRDTRTLGIVVIMPVFMLALYGYAITFDVRHLRLGVYDQDRSQQSRDLVGAFSHSEYFDLTSQLASYREVTESLDRGRVKAVLVIPTHFTGDLGAGRTATVQLMVDGSDSTTANTAIGYANAIIQQWSAENVVLHLRAYGLPVKRAAPPIDSRVRFWYNPELKSTNFIVPGLLAVILTMLAALLTSMTVVREREQGSIEQLVVSPVMPYELMVGKLVPYTAIAFVDVILVIAVGRLLFNVPLRGSPLLVLLCSAIFLTAALGIGLLISTVARSQQTAMMGAMLTSLLPSILLSGFLFPISAMPRVVQLLTNLVPATHFLAIVRPIFLKGGGLALIWPPAFVLLAFGLLLLAVSSLRFKKTL